MFSSNAPNYVGSGFNKSSTAPSTATEGFGAAARPASRRFSVTNLSEVPLIEPQAAHAPTGVSRPALNIQSPDPNAPVGPSPAFERTYLQRQQELARKLSVALQATGQKRPDPPVAAPEVSDVEQAEAPTNDAPATHSEPGSGSESATSNVLILSSFQRTSVPTVDIKA